MKFRAYSIKQEKAIAAKLKELESLTSPEIYQKNLIEVMQGKTSPQQEEAIQFAWDAFEKSQGEYKLLLLQDDGTREFQQILQNKEEEITTLKKVLKENLLGQF